MIEGGFEAKILYLQCVQGSKIVEECDRINASENMKVIATQFFQVPNGYDAFIHYKAKQQQQTIKINITQ
jgi:hypothetical protein